MSKQDKLYDENGIKADAMDLMVERLGEVFPPSKVKFRIGRKSGKSQRATALSYLDARDYQERLTSVVGPWWQVDYQEHPGGQQLGLMATISIKIAGEWVARSDGANIGENRGAGNEQTGTAEKAAFTDAFKRACTAWGMGLELYRWPRDEWYEIDEWNNFVECPLFPTYIYDDEEIKEAVKLWTAINRGTRNQRNNTARSNTPKKTKKKPAKKNTYNEETLARADAVVVPKGEVYGGKTLGELRQGSAAEKRTIQYFAGAGKNPSGASFVAETDEAKKLQSAAKYILEGEKE